MKILLHEHKMSQGLIVSMGIALGLIIGFADYITGKEISFSIFYLLPILLVTWFHYRTLFLLCLE